MMPSKNGSRLGLAVLLASLSLAAFSEARTLATLDDIATQARTSSLSYQQAEAAARSAEIAVPDVLKLLSSTLATSYSSVADSTTSTSKGLTMTATLPILDQLSLTGKYVIGGSTTLTATATPLSHADTRYQALITYQKALSAADEAGRSAAVTAIKDALAWMSAARTLETEQRAVQVMEDTYEATKAANAIDATTATVDDLITALKNLSSARASLVTAQATERRAAGALYAALGASKADIDISRIDLATLSKALDELEASLSAAMDSSIAESYAVKVASLTVQSDRSTLDSIWPYEPVLSLSGGMTMAADGTITPKLSATLTLSPGYFTGDKKEVARTALELAQKTLSQQKTADQNSYDEAVATVKAAKITTESSRLAYQQAVDVADVAAFNLRAGESSQIECDTANLAVTQAEDALYQSLADEYSAWLDLAALAANA
jgi:hypothetical protein